MAVAYEDDQHDDAVAQRARVRMTEATTKLARHRAALEAGADPALVTSWIAQTQAERAVAEAELRRSTGRTRITRDQIAALVAGLGNLLAVLHTADPTDKAEVYRQLGLKLTYHLGTQTVEAEAHLDPYCGVMVGVRGGT